MHHTFRFAASRFKDDETLAVHLHARLSGVIEEAEFADPVREDGAIVVWLDVGGDRYRVAMSRDTAAQQAGWHIAIERPEPAFVRRGAGHARHRERFDGLVAATRTIILEDPTSHLIAESDD